MSTFLTVVAALAFFLCVLASIGLHEVGHLLPAKRFGVRVPEYFIGFGPKLWSFRRGETEYGVKLVPLGGYVRLLGMYPPRTAARRPGAATQLDELARSAEWSQITPQDVADDRLLYQKKPWQRLIVLAGGPTMNIAIAFFLFWAIIGLHGYNQAQPVVSAVKGCVIPVTRTNADCTATDPASPAKRAGITAGDRIVAFNGVRVSGYQQLVDLIRANLDHEATVVVQRGGQEVTLPTVHTVITGVSDKWDPSRRVPAGWFGISPTFEVVKGGPDEVVRQMWSLTAQSGLALVQFPVKVFNVVADLLTGRPRDVYGPISIVGATVAAGQVAASDQLTGVEKVDMFASLLASLNLFLALFNFVPLPPLDGGHIAGVLYEWVRSGVAKLRGKPDPGPFDSAKMLPLAYAVAAFLIVSGVILIIADILSPIRIF